MARVLLAEDEPRISSFIEKGLSANGFAVTVVADGSSAYEYAVTGGFDLMILDIGLPEMDGFTVLRKLRDEANSIALVETFLRHPGQVLSREQLLSQVWGYDFDPGSNVVDVYVRYLRRKLGAERFVTLRGMGYRLEALP